MFRPPPDAAGPAPPRCGPGRPGGRDFQEDPHGSRHALRADLDPSDINGIAAATQDIWKAPFSFREVERKSVLQLRGAGVSRSLTIESFGDLRKATIDIFSVAGASLRVRFDTRGATAMPIEVTSGGTEGLRCAP